MQEYLMNKTNRKQEPGNTQGRNNNNRQSNKGNTRVYIDWVNKITSNTWGDNQGEPINKGTTKLDTGNQNYNIKVQTLQGTYSITMGLQRLFGTLDVIALNM